MEVAFSVIDGKFVAQCIGDESTLHFTQPLTGDNVQSCDKRHKYSVKRLLQIAKSTNLGATVVLWLSEADERLLIRYSVGTLGRVTYALSSIGKLEKVIELPTVREVRPKPSGIKIVAFKRPVKRGTKRKSVAASASVGSTESKSSSSNIKSI